MKHNKQYLETTIRKARSLVQADLAATTSTPRDEGGGGGENLFLPRRVVELIKEYEASGKFKADWLWDGFLEPETLLVFGADPKEGKSTFAMHLVHALSQGEPFLERATQIAPILWLGLDESQRHTLKKFRDMGTSSNDIFFVPAPFKATQGNMDAVSKWIKQKGRCVIVVDTFSQFLIIEQENSSTDVTRAIEPIKGMLRNTGSAMILLHHNRKSGGEGVKAIRGSSATLALADVIVAIQRKDNVINLEIESRYTETPSKITAELRDGKFELLSASESSTVVEESRFELLVQQAVTDEAQAVIDVVEASGVTETTARRILDRFAREGSVIKEGSGLKGHPHTYRKTKQMDGEPQ